MYQDRKDETDIGLRTVTLSIRDLKAAARVLEMLVGAEGDGGSATAKRPQPMFRQVSGEDRPILVDRARLAFENRRRRSQHFSSAMFGEAAWDMLLALYVKEQSGTRHSVSELCELSGAPQTTALRWLDYLENKDHLVAREPSPTDRRIFLVGLTDKGRESLDLYFSGTVPPGL